MYLTNLTSKDKNYPQPILYTSHFELLLWPMTFSKDNIAVQLNPGRFVLKPGSKNHSIFGKIPTAAASIWEIQHLVPSCWDPVAWRLRCASSSLQCFGARFSSGMAVREGMAIGTFSKNSKLGGDFKYVVYFHPASLQKWSNLMSIFFQMGWNHQLERDSYANGDMGMLLADGFEKCGEKTSWG